MTTYLDEAALAHAKHQSCDPKRKLPGNTNTVGHPQSSAIGKKRIRPGGQTRGESQKPRAKNSARTVRKPNLCNTGKGKGPHRAHNHCPTRGAKQGIRPKTPPRTRPVVTPLMVPKQNRFRKIPGMVGITIGDIQRHNSPL